MDLGELVGRQRPGRGEGDRGGKQSQAGATAELGHFDSPLQSETRNGGEP